MHLYINILRDWGIPVSLCCGVFSLSSKYTPTVALTVGAPEVALAHESVTAGLWSYGTGHRVGNAEGAALVLGLLEQLPDVVCVHVLILGLPLWYYRGL